MTITEHPDQSETDTAVIPGSPDEIVPAQGTEPTAPEAPEALSPEEVRDFQARAGALVAELGNASGSKELQQIDGISGLGVQAQRRAGSELDLLRGRMKDIFTRDGPNAELWADLLEMRKALERIDPQQLSRPSLNRRLSGLLSFVRRSAPGLKALERIALRHESVSKEVEVIEARLREGRMMLSRDNVELRKLYEQVEAQQVTIQKNAYLGELIIRELAALIDRTDDPLKAERLRSPLHDVATRVQDLRMMEEVGHQFFVSIEMTRENNARLGQSVERTLALGTNVVTIGLAIQVALARQKRVLEATRRTREFLGGMIAANAAAIKRHTAEIGDVYNSPVIAIEKVTQAHQDLVDAIDMANRIKQEGIEAARENIARLGEMSADLQRRSGALRDPGRVSTSVEV